MVLVSFLFCLTLWFLLRGDSCWVVPCSLLSCFVSTFSIVITSLSVERESWSMCFSCICLFIVQALIFVLLLFFVVSGVAAACYSGTPWIFLLLFMLVLFFLALWSSQEDLFCSPSGVLRLCGFTFISSPSVPEEWCDLWLKHSFIVFLLSQTNHIILCNKTT